MKRSEVLQLLSSQGHLRGAELQECDLVSENLSGVDLRRANLTYANLRFATFAGADLRNANLTNVTLTRADLRGADLRGALLPSPAVLLSAYWECLSEGLTRDLMRLDASAHPDPASFDIWAQGGACPYRYGQFQFQRVANFVENRLLWVPGPPPSLWELTRRILDECCPGWEGDPEAERSPATSSAESEAEEAAFADSEIPEGLTDRQRIEALERQVRELTQRELNRRLT